MNPRSSIVWVNGGVRGGLYVASMYQPDGEGVQGERGRQLINQMGEFLYAAQKPFIWAADFNSLPSE
eukprot:8790729-Pyramimonas_sp.AAC.1